MHLSTTACVGLGAQLRTRVRARGCVSTSRGASLRRALAVRNQAVRESGTVSTTTADAPIAAAMGAVGLKLSPVFNEVLAEEVANQGEGSVQKVRCQWNEAGQTARIGQDAPRWTAWPLPVRPGAPHLQHVEDLQASQLNYSHDFAFPMPQIYGPKEWQNHKRVFRYVRHLQNLGGCVPRRVFESVSQYRRKAFPHVGLRNLSAASRAAQRAGSGSTTLSGDTAADTKGVP